MPLYLNEVSEKSPQSSLNTRSNYQKLILCFFLRFKAEQSALSFIGTSNCNKIPENLKKLNNATTHK